MSDASRGPVPTGLTEALTSEVLDRLADRLNPMSPRYAIERDLRVTLDSAKWEITRLTKEVEYLRSERDAMRRNERQALDAHSASFIALDQVAQLVGMDAVDEYTKVVDEVKAYVARDEANAKDAERLRDRIRALATNHRAAAAEEEFEERYRHQSIADTMDGLLVSTEVTLEGFDDEQPATPEAK